MSARSFGRLFGDSVPELFNALSNTIDCTTRLFTVVPKFSDYFFDFRRRSAVCRNLIVYVVPSYS